MKKLTYQVIVVNEKTNDIIYTSVDGKSAYECRVLAESLYKNKNTRVTLGACLSD
jgi:hypothetical protein